MKYERIDSLEAEVQRIDNVAVISPYYGKYRVDIQHKSGRAVRWDDIPYGVSKQEAINYLTRLGFIEI